MENTVFYTFSTISQTLAAMVALLGVFSIYQLQSLNNKFIDLSQGYLDFLNSMEVHNIQNSAVWFVNRDLRKLITSKHYQGILNLSVSEYSKWGDSYSELTNFSKSITKITDDKGRVIKKTVFITMSSLIIIIGSLIVLSIATNISTLTFWIIFTLFLSAIGFVFWQIFQLIKFSLSSDL